MTARTQSTLRIAQLNAENLFIYLDHFENQNLETLDEKSWQALSTSIIPNKPLKKTKWLAESIKHIDPDIIFLNEVGGLESLENFNWLFLDGVYQVFLIEGNSDRGIDLGYLVHPRWQKDYLLLSHKSRSLNFNYPHERIWNEQVNNQPEKKQYPSHRFSRDVLELRAFDPVTKKLECIFLNCHLKSKLDRDGIDPKGLDRRQAEFQTLLKIYEELKKETQNQVPINIAGDFNGVASSEKPDLEFLEIQKTDLKNALLLANRSEEERFTRFDFKTGQPPKGQQIDYIFLSELLHDKVVTEE
ncbi:MAG: hypothetical protein KDD34_09395, partial [Bdellovibrionales bacterium]|nr:hypothetical protein [Bdellovibrionales bacterium]